MTHTQGLSKGRTTVSPPAPVPAIRATGLTKQFGSVRAVNGVDLVVERSEVVALLGPNGAGKTTLIDMLLAFTPPTSGSIDILGTSPARAVASGSVSAVLQTGALLNDLSVKDTVRMVAACHHSPQPIQAVMERAGITGLASRKVGKCSGGEQQRLRFALSLLSKPTLLFLDEPTAGMDVRARKEFWETIHAEADRGLTVVFATHYLQEAADFADRIILLRDGRIERDGTFDQLTGTKERTLQCTWTASSAPEDTARVHEATVAREAHQRVTFTARDTDELARDILNGNKAHSLDIHAATLDDIFLELTEGHEAQ